MSEKDRITVRTIYLKSTSTHMEWPWKPRSSLPVACLLRAFDRGGQEVDHEGPSDRGGGRSHCGLNLE